MNAVVMCFDADVTGEGEGEKERCVGSIQPLLNAASIYFCAAWCPADPQCTVQRMRCARTRGVSSGESDALSSAFEPPVPWKVQRLQISQTRRFFFVQLASFRCMSMY